MNPTRRAFTLVELLVVVAIIVVLLALLLPAMGKAIYQANLAKCGSQMKSIAGGASLYAFDNKRAYMDRFIHRGEGFPYGLKGASAEGGNASVEGDDRPMHKGYIALDALMDPLAEAVDLEGDEPGAVVYCNYVLYYGFGYRGETPMQRIGDRWTFQDTKVGPNGPRYEFSWLVTDLDIIRWGTLTATAGHPDKNRVLNPAFAQAGRFEHSTQQEQATWGNVPVTYSFWRRLGKADRGPMDLNFASEDGGVIRLNDVEYIYDERIAHVPNVGTRDAYPNRWLNIAKP